MRNHTFQFLAELNTSFNIISGNELPDIINEVDNFIENINKNKDQLKLKILITSNTN